MEKRIQSPSDGVDETVGKTDEVQGAADPAPGLVAELYREALVYFDSGDLASAQKLFQRAADADPSHAQARSHLGVCLAANERKFEQAVALCTSAAKQEFFNPDLYLNLAKVHLVFGFKTEGRRFLLRGRMIDPANENIQAALKSLGARNEPIIRFLPRRHIINRWLGEARHLIALRSSAQVSV
jgi:Flp pilus assembly protein TadD